MIILLFGQLGLLLLQEAKIMFNYFTKVMSNKSTREEKKIMTFIFL